MGEGFLKKNCPLEAAFRDHSTSLSLGSHFGDLAKAFLFIFVPGLVLKTD